MEISIEMNLRKVGPFDVNAVGLGCMGMSHGYGKPDRENSARTLRMALDLGYNFLDTAALYGFGENEKLIGEVLANRRSEYVLASKCGLIRGSDGKRSLDARPSVIRQTCEESLRNLKTDCIDIYYLHRVDPKVSLEDQIGTLAQLIDEGKIVSIGLSEVSATTLRKANAIHPIAALQSEYSLWTRNPENQVLDTCKELGISFVAFSPLGRGFLTGKLQDTKNLLSTDLRMSMPRFSEDNLPKNLALLVTLKEIAETRQSTMAQVALAWVLTKQPEIILIPGTTNIDHVAENFAAQEFILNMNEMELLDKTFHSNAIFGERYDEATLASMET
jgi:aryl-alcohol dehydrogenase-like predicted oxidoreductase